MKSLRIVFAGLLLLTTLYAHAEAEVTAVRLWPAPDNTRLVFELSGAMEHRLFMLRDPERLVIDLKDTRFGKNIGRLEAAGELVGGVRSAPHDGSLRVVLDLKQRVQPKTFTLPPSQGYDYRLVIDLYPEGGDEIATLAAAAERPSGTGKASDLPKAASSPPAKAPAASPARGRDLVVAIDAGHGGEDPGAIGAKGTREKDVVLAIARKLKALVASEPGIKPVMIRDGDYFVSLGNRVRKARTAKADLFISIHADAFLNRSANGSSVYMLSDKGATSEHARFLAQKENDSDLVGGVSLDDKDDLLASVLLDLSQTATKEASSDLAERVLGNLGGLGKLHKSHVERAGFRVLKAPDIPSILVETAFISNHQEERLLKSAQHQQSLANAIFKGITTHLRRYAPPGTLIAQQAALDRNQRGTSDLRLVAAPPAEPEPEPITPQTHLADKDLDPFDEDNPLSAFR